MCGCRATPLLLFTYLFLNHHADALTEPFGVPRLTAALLLLFVHLLHSFWAGHCGIPRRPKTPSDFTVHFTVGVPQLAAAPMLLLVPPPPPPVPKLRQNLRLQHKVVLGHMKSTVAPPFGCLVAPPFGCLVAPPFGAWTSRCLRTRAYAHVHT